MGKARLELWLVRHGETTRSRDGLMAGWSNVRLTDKGKDEARALRPVLDGTGFDGAWSSDLARARVTARLAWGQASPDARLREICFGELEGAPWRQMDQCHRDALLTFDGFRFPGGESFRQLSTRVNAFLAELPAGRHLVVTHGGVIRLLSRQAGDDSFLATGALIVLDWPARRVLRLHGGYLTALRELRRAG